MSEKYTVLVVDDEPEIVEMMANYFRKKGFNAETAISGEDAVDYVEEGKPVQIIVSDVRMKNGDGPFIIQKLKEMQKNIPVFLVTGFSETSDEDLLHLGALEVFHKPVARKDLLAKVMAVLQQEKAA